MHRGKLFRRVERVRRVVATVFCYQSRENVEKIDNGGHYVARCIAVNGARETVWTHWSTYPVVKRDDDDVGRQEKEMWGGTR